MKEPQRPGRRNVAADVGAIRTISDEALMQNSRVARARHLSSFLRVIAGRFMVFPEATARRRARRGSHAGNLPGRDPRRRALRTHCARRHYLYRIAMNLLAAERRRCAKDSPQVTSLRRPATRQAADSVLWIRQALDKLDESEREILMLRSTSN